MVPADLLPDMKAHLNVSFDDDDRLIERYLAWALGYAEQDSGAVLPDPLPAIAEAYVFRVAATLYENRESISAVPSLDQMPGWMNDRLAGLWVPRA